MNKNDNKFFSNNCKVEKIINVEDIHQDLLALPNAGHTKLFLDKKEPLFKVIEDHKVTIFSTHRLIYKIKKEINAAKEALIIKASMSVLLMAPLLMGLNVFNVYTTIFLGLVGIPLSFLIFKSGLHLKKLISLKRYVIKNSKDYLNYDQAEYKKKIEKQKELKYEEESKPKYIL